MHVRKYIAELGPEVLDGRIETGRVFDLEVPFTELTEPYATLDEPRAIKVLYRQRRGLQGRITPLNVDVRSGDSLRA